MSFILKALKKLEEEKTAQRVGPQDINRAILTPDRAPAKSSNKALKPVLILLLILAASGIASLFLLRAPVALPQAKNSIAGEVSRDNQAVPPPPVQPVSDLTTRAAAEPEPAGPNRAAAASGERAPAAEAARSPRNSTGAQPTGTGRTGQEPAVSSSSGLKVNGIALQDDPSESMAVVNGILVKRGMTVHGMRVEEIFHNRVRFSGNGETYEVQMSK